MDQARDARWAVGASVLGLVVIAGLMAAALMEPGGTDPDSDLISIPTSQPVPAFAPCADALLEGELVVHPDWGLAVGSPEEPYLTFWPHGYVARNTREVVELLDDQGQVVARAGDHLSLGGGGTTIDGRDGFRVCPGQPIRVVPAP